VTVLAAGTGGPAAAAGAATALAVVAPSGEPFGLVLSMGTAGGFRGAADIGDILVADRLVAADLGAESGAVGDADFPPGRPLRGNDLDLSLGFADYSGMPAASVGTAESGRERPGNQGRAPFPTPPEAQIQGAHASGAQDPRVLSGFLSLDDLGLGTGSFTPDDALVRRMANSLASTGRRVVTGTVITVATVTGTERRAVTLTQRYDPVGEAMEGYAVGTAASVFGVPMIEIRAVSNQVGRRDRSTWDIPAALASLRAVAGALVGHPEGLLADFGSPAPGGAGPGS
jgi:futalosine hydrolase